MSIKNILIGIGVIGTGFILYKLLFGFVLPIALFVSLGYILKFLLKPSDSNSEEEVPQILRGSGPTAANENIVEIKPVGEVISAEEDKSIEQEKPS